MEVECLLYGGRIGERWTGNLQVSSFYKGVGNGALPVAAQAVEALEEGDLIP